MANNYGDPSKWKESKKKPTEAFTTKGTAAKGLATSKAKNRFSSDAKTKVKSATGGLAGGGTPLGASMALNPISKSQVAGAVGAAVGGAVAGRAITKVAPVVASAGKKIVQKAATDYRTKAAAKAESKAFDNIVKNYKFDSPTNPLSKSESKAFDKIAKPEIKAAQDKIKTAAKNKKLNQQMAKNANQSDARLLAEYLAIGAGAAGIVGGIGVGTKKIVDGRDAKLEKTIKQQRRQTTSNIPSKKFPK
jgi:hypothetical protein